jgi:hypothetical protein
MKRKNKAVKSEEEEMDEDDRLMFETAKKNENTHKCGTYRQNKVFKEN